MSVQKKQNRLSILASSLTGALLVSATLVACAPEKAPRNPAQQQAKAQTLVQNSASWLNPTVSTPTDLEGAWVGECINGSVTNAAGTKTAESYNVGYIFKGNSFYKQI